MAEIIFKGEDNKVLRITHNRLDSVNITVSSKNANPDTFDVSIKLKETEIKYLISYLEFAYREVIV